MSSRRCARCPNPAHARDLCEPCYNLAWRHGEFGLFSGEPNLRPGLPCGWPGCQDPVHARGLCRRHAYQVQRHGQVTDPARWWAPPPAWTAQARCAGEGDPDTWFAGPSDTAAAGAAKAICAACPVRPDCLAHALAAGEEHGIWGGLTESERAPLLAAKEPAA